jgi:hypothetical protein
VPVSWASKVQTKITLSTMEAEYIALATATRKVLALCNQLEEMMKALEIEKGFKFVTHSQVFEDNTGALALAISPTLMPQSKHYAMKYRFFKSHTK